MLDMRAWFMSFAQALVSGKKYIPRYYIYHKVRNRSFVKYLGHRDFRVFFNSTDASMEEWPISSETTIIYLQNDV